MAKKETIKGKNDAVAATDIVNTFDFKSIEDKWKPLWYDNNIYKADDFSKKEKKYVLCEFPYPSGSGLHVGHAFTYSAGDVYARYMRMKGFNTMFPMGYDAFGLPTENYAIKMKRKPQEVTKENTDNYHREMNDLGFSFAWDREVNTTDPDYYKWTQWIFLKLYEKGLAYKEERAINWCPSCKIGLANEEIVDGNCERCHAETSTRNISQWIVKITDYADRLIEGLKDTNIQEKVKAAQINWIGRKEGININFEVKDSKEIVTCFTTTPVNFGATFLVIAPEHPIVKKITIDEQKDEVEAYVKAAAAKSDLDREKDQKSKTGVFTGSYAINHVDGKEIPIYVTDFVLMNYGTGAVQGCPAHDERDFDFATKFGLPIIRVVQGNNGEVKADDVNEVDQVKTGGGEKRPMVNSEFLNGIPFDDAMQKTMDHFVEKGWGERVVNYHLRDWIFSRQHYWGEPIPMIKCEKCGWVPMPEEELPLKLPEVENYEPTDDGRSPLANITEWVQTTCPTCGGEAERETDTMPNWAGSDWYFIRYADAHCDNAIAGEKEMKYWLPVDVYIGGDEHNTLHMLYSRFIHQFLYDIKAVPTPEPYDQRISHGVILGEDGSRMSKSRGNVIVPDHYVEKVGADALRTYLMFMGPFDGTIAWNDNAVAGVKRFTERVYRYITNGKGSFGKEDSSDVSTIFAKTIEAAQTDIEKFQFNTVVAKYMELINFLEKTDINNVSVDSIKKFILLLAPFAPFMAEELWQEINGFSEWKDENSVHLQEWPKFDEKFLIEKTIEIPVQVNGKMRGTIVIDAGTSESDVKSQIESDEKFDSYLEGGMKKFIYVPNKIANVIV
jgi:leucyl-tRNA synthetase